MSDTLKWTFQMLDRMSGPAKTASRGMGELLQSTHAALASVQILGQAAAGAGRLIAAGLAPAISREKSLGAFETLLGTAEKARDMYGQAVEFAAETPFETAQVVDSFQRLLTAKFAEDEVPIAMRIIGDAASMQEDSQMAVQAVTRALSQIRSKGRLQGEELMQLQEAVPLNTAALYERLGKIYGTNAQAARKMIEAGQIDSQVASFAILGQLQEQFGGNMARSSKQVEGLISTLRSRPSEILSQMQDTQGYDALRDSLAGIAYEFDAATPAGQQLQQIVNDLGSGTLERVAVALEYGAKGAAAFASGLAEGLGPMGEAFGPTNATNMEKFTTAMNQFGTGAGQLATAISSVISPIQTFFGLFYKFGEWQASSYGEWIMKPFEWLATSSKAGLFRGQAINRSAVSQINAADEAGRNPYAGMVGPSEALQQELLALAGTGYADNGYEAGAAYADGTEQGLRDGLGWHSPPRLFVEAGEDSAGAFGLGMSRGRNGVQAAMMDTTRPAMGGGAGISVTFGDINVYAKDGQGIGQSIIAQVEPAIISFLERLALQSGRLT